MADDEYQANWRGSRRYQFDEEARRKAARNVYKFRRIKHGDPVKLKVLVEDIWPKRSSYNILPVALLVLAAFAVAFLT